MKLTPKQADFWKNAIKRYNIKCGARRSGKTYLDYFMIPKRIFDVKGLDGHVYFLGNTRDTLQTNVIEPMQRIWGKQLVGDIKTNNIATIFGEKVRCYGADKVGQLTRVKGSSIKYCYGDEIVTWAEPVFNELKGCFDKPYSKLDATCNPTYPTHYIKKFIDENEEVFYQQYTIYDNKFLNESVKRSLEQAYPKGTIWNSRYIWGEWSVADGVIYLQFANNPKAFIKKKDEIPRFAELNIGIDFGGTNSAHAFVASGITANYKELYFLMSERHDAKNTTPSDVDRMVLDFIEKVIDKYGYVYRVQYDNAEQVLGRGIKKAIQSKYNNISVRECLKPPIIDRIRLFTRLMGTGRFFITEDCKTLETALCQAVWDAKKEDTRLDDGSTPIDDIDAAEYSIANRIRQFI